MKVKYEKPDGHTGAVIVPEVAISGSFHQVFFLQGNKITYQLSVIYESAYPQYEDEGDYAGEFHYHIYLAPLKSISVEEHLPSNVSKITVCSSAGASSRKMKDIAKTTSNKSVYIYIKMYSEYLPTFLNTIINKLKKHDPNKVDFELMTENFYFEYPVDDYEVEEFK